MKKLVGLQKILFLVWIISLAVFSHGAIVQYKLSSLFALVSMFVGSIAFLLIWLVALTKLRHKPRINAARFPLFTIVATLVWLLGLTQLASANIKNQPQATIEKKEIIQTSPTPTPKPEVKKKTTTSKNNITCTGPDGKQFQTTQKECDDFNSAWGNEPKTQPNNSDFPSQPKRIETQTTQKQPLCTVGGITYYYTDPTTCTRWQQEQKNFEQSLESINNTPTSQNTYTNNVPTQDTSALLEQCKSEAYNKYQVSEQQAMVLYGGASSAGPAMIQIAKDTLNNDLATCEYVY